MKHRGRRLKPWLWDTHFSFAVAYLFEAAAFLWVFIEMHWGGQEGQWDAATLVHINDFMPPMWWANVAGIIGVLLVAGLYRDDFRLARFALVLAFAYVLVNTVLMIWARLEGLPTGIGLQVRLAILGNLGVQAYFEPPVNPAARRKD